MADTYHVGAFQYAKSLRSFAAGPLQWLKRESGSPESKASKPCAVLDFQHTALTASSLRQIIEAMVHRDDVFNEGFLSSLFILGPLKDSEPPPEDEILRCLVDIHVLDICVIQGSYIPPGPYILDTNGEPRLHPALKLCPDPFGAFMYGVLRTDEDTPSYKKAPTHRIPVPSRLLFNEPSPSKPLLGKRVAIKDIFDIRGLKTGASCKSYEACYDEAQSTASAIQKLIDMGAVIVGKTKTVQLASGMSARDWVDYQCPFNPRGDGYQDPDCSSSGSAVAVAAYLWLDFAIGSDSLGSMVGPAAVNGIYGIRPTHGLQERDGTLLVSNLFDTAGIFSRSVHEFLNLTNLWYEQAIIKAPQFPRRIFLPQERFEPYHKQTCEVMSAFISDLEQVTGIQKTPLDFEKLWSKNNQAHTSLGKYVEKTLAHIQLYDSYHNNSKFRRDHNAKFGYGPYVEPMIQYKWNLGAQLTKKEYETACHEREIFRQFMIEKVFADDTVMLLPGGYPNVIYRDEYSASFEEHGRKFQGFGFKDTAFSVLGGLPCISFPAGQEPYHSKITNKEEYRPVSLMLLGAPGTDSLLIDVVRRVLETSKRPSDVRVGKTVFCFGD